MSQVLKDAALDELNGYEPLLIISLKFEPGTHDQVDSMLYRAKWISDQLLVRFLKDTIEAIETRHGEWLRT